jgi:hypothetical protein
VRREVAVDREAHAREVRRKTWLLFTEPAHELGERLLVECVGEFFFCTCRELARGREVHQLKLHHEGS